MQNNELNLAKVGTLTFEEPDLETFRCLALAYEAAKVGYTMPCVLNGANEVAVSLFLQKKIGFLEIAEVNEWVMQAHSVVMHPTVSDIIEADRWARETALSYFEKK